MHLIEDHILRKVHENVVLVPVSDRETDFRGMIALNHTGEFVCKMLEHDTDKGQLVAALAEEYEVELKQVETDVEAFLLELEKCHMLIQ